MLFPRIPSRPVRYALIATHAFRDAISDVEVDFTKAEQAIADRLERLALTTQESLDALTTKVDALMDKLAAYEEANDDTPEDEPKAKTKPRAKPKAKAKR